MDGRWSADVTLTNATPRSHTAGWHGAIFTRHRGRSSAEAEAPFSIRDSPAALILERDTSLSFEVADTTPAQTPTERGQNYATNGLDQLVQAQGGRVPPR
jgi:hypothetical protein